MSPGLEIRPFKQDDRDRLLQIFRTVFNKEYDPAVWKWKFEQNPFQPPGHPFIYVVEKGGEIAGAVSLLPVPFQIEQQRLPFYWGTDLMAHPRFQGLGIGKTLYRYLSEKHEIVMSIGATEAAFKLLVKKTAWFKMSGFKRLSCYLDPAPYLRKRIPLAGRIPGVLSRLLLRPVLAKPRHGAHATDSLRKITEIGPEFDRLWDEVEPYFPVSVCRTRQYLQWRYQSEPHKNYVCHGLFQKKKLLGFFVLEFGRPVTKNGFSEGLLMELVANPTDDETISLLIQGAVDIAFDKGCHLVRCVSASGNEILFRRQRFYNFPQWDIRFFGTVNLNKISVEKMKDPDLWMLAFGDCCF